MACKAWPVTEDKKLGKRLGSGTAFKIKSVSTFTSTSANSNIQKKTNKTLMLLLLARIQGNWGHWTCYLITCKHASSGKFYGDDKRMAHKFKGRLTLSFTLKTNRPGFWTIRTSKICFSFLFLWHSCLFISIDLFALWFIHVIMIFIDPPLFVRHFSQHLQFTQDQFKFVSLWSL